MSEHRPVAELPVLNLAAYHFCAVDDPQCWIDWIRVEATRQGLRGSVLVAPEGVNLFLAGGDAAIQAFLDAFRAFSGIDAMELKFSRSRHVPFARLKVKRKREIISFRQPDSDPRGGRAAAVTPQQLRRWIDQGHDESGRPLVLLDTRNREEVAAGTFRNAIALAIDNFTDFPRAVLEQRDALRDAAVVSFCTGGIRCEKAALWMQAQGLPVYQLEGGILGYFEQVGSHGYEGNCFVFDERRGLQPDLSPVCDQYVPSVAERHGGTPS